jgi:hypothetical protein
MPEFLIIKRGDENCTTASDKERLVFVSSFCWMLQTPALVDAFHYRMGRLLSDPELAPSCPSPVSPPPPNITDCWLLPVSTALLVCEPRRLVPALRTFMCMKTAFKSMV